MAQRSESRAISVISGHCSERIFHDIHCNAVTPVAFPWSLTNAHTCKDLFWNRKLSARAVQFQLLATGLVCPPLQHVQVLLYCDSASDAVYPLVNDRPSNEAFYCTSYSGSAGFFQWDENGARSGPTFYVSHCLRSMAKSSLRLSLLVYDECTRMHRPFFGVANVLYSPVSS